MDQKVENDNNKKFKYGWNRIQTLEIKFLHNKIQKTKRIPPGPPSIDNGEHGSEMLLLNNQVSKDFAYWNESTNIMYYSVRWWWTKI